MINHFVLFWKRFRSDIKRFDLLLVRSIRHCYRSLGISFDRCTEIYWHTIDLHTPNLFRMVNHRALNRLQYNHVLEPVHLSLCVYENKVHQFLWLNVLFGGNHNKCVFLFTHLHSYSTPLTPMVVLELVISIPFTELGCRSPSLHCNEPHFTFLWDEETHKWLAPIFSELFKFHLRFRSNCEYLLHFASPVITISIFATVSIDGTFRVKLVIALRISWYSTVAPNFLTLTI